MTTNQIIGSLRSKIYDKKWYMKEYLDKSCPDDRREMIAIEGFIEGLEFTINKLKEEHDECI